MLLLAISLCIWGTGSIAAEEQEQEQEQEQEVYDQGRYTPAIVPTEAPATASSPDTAPANPETDTAPTFTAEEQLDNAHNRFLSYFNDELYRQALVAARQTLQLASDYYGDDSLETALALTNVATAQTKTGDLPAAVASYEISIDLIEKREGIISPRLINPLMGLAATHNNLGAYDAGLSNYERALRINHVELGLNNNEQMQIRDGLTESYLGLGDRDKANFQQETQARIIRDEHRGDLDKIIPAIYKLADWYKRSNQPEKETLLLQNAARTIKKAAGDDPREQIRVLRALAAAHQRLDMPAEAMRLLKKAWRINEESEARDPLLSADIQVEMGDFYNGFNDLRDARRSYTQAWETLVNEGGNDSARLLENYFSKPIIIWSVQLPDVYPLNSKTAVLAMEEPDLFREGLLAVEFDIDQNGRTTNIRIIESDPEGLMDKRIIYLLGRYFYRPRFEDGAPALTKDIQLSHNFSYLAKSAKKDQGKSKDNSDDRLEYPGDVD
jgi:tetratricopeptide (TPR) repeat protein